MICHGDELGRTQGGNNNAYCQDNEISWINWDLDEQDKDLLEFTRTIMWLRRDHPVLRRRRFFTGDAGHGGESELGEIEWLTPAGESMTDQDWTTWYARAMMVFLNGEAIAEPDERGQRIVDSSFLVLINASDEDITFTLPGEAHSPTWKAPWTRHPRWTATPTQFSPRTRPSWSRPARCSSLPTLPSQTPQRSGSSGRNPRQADAQPNTHRQQRTARRRPDELRKSHDRRSGRSSG